jgi:tripartite-type tricarboxylate transporter receptor subunit TctC
MKRLHMAAILLTTLLSVGAFGQAYPSKPVTVIVPTAPGGPSDLVARVWAEKLGGQFGKTFVVDNRPGASQVIGTQAVAKAEADGYTVLQAASSMAINLVTMDGLPYDTLKDFAPVSLTHLTPLVVVVSAQSPFKTLKDLVEHAKAHPGKLSYGSTGDGSSQQLAMLLLAREAKLEGLTEVRYKGSTQAHPDLMSNRLDVMIDPVAAVAPHIKSGSLRALAVTTAARLPKLAQVPTVAESGFPSYEVVSWGGVFVPAKTPKDVIAKLNSALVAALGSADTGKRFDEWGLVPKAGTADEFGVFMTAEVGKWRAVLKPAK